MDIIEIQDIKLKTLIGVYPWEKKHPQQLVIGICFALPNAIDPPTDDLQNTIDYDDIIDHIITFAQEHHFQLLETLAENLIQSLFNHFPTPWIKLSVNKPFANLKAKGIRLTLERNRRAE